MSGTSGGFVSRRRLLGGLGGAGLAAAVGFTVPVLSRQQQTGKLLPSGIPLPPPFQLPLRIPQVLVPIRHADYGDADFYEVTQRVASQEILPGVATQIWGYDGTYPGPTIISGSGQRTVVRHHNALPVPTVTHLHGGHTPPTSDGFPTDLLYPQPGPDVPMKAMPGMAPMANADPLARTALGYRDYDYPLAQPAATLWYHDHRMGFTGQGVWRGLAGFHLINDAGEAHLPLPRGDRDVPLMIADRSFGPDGALQYPAVDPSALAMAGVSDPYMGGVLGDVILVNGVPWPVFEVAAARYRFRLLNGSNARRYGLALSPPPPGGAGLVQIGSDGGLLDHPIGHDRIEIAAAERFEVIIDFSRYPVGQEITLANDLGSGGTSRVMRFRVTHRKSDDTTIPARLSTVEHTGAGAAERIRSFVFQNHDRRSWTINGKEFDPTVPAATPRLGGTEIWRLTTDFHHSVHIHLVQFRVLSRNGKAPGQYDAGWKDTVDLKPAEEAAVIARFADYPGRYVMHCHNLEHEDMAMMATFTVS